MLSDIVDTTNVVFLSNFGINLYSFITGLVSPMAYNNSKIDIYVNLFDI